MDSRDKYNLASRFVAAHERQAAALEQLAEQAAAYVEVAKAGQDAAVRALDAQTALADKMSNEI